jgi:hypothetical protein
MIPYMIFSYYTIFKNKFLGKFKNSNYIKNYFNKSDNYYYDREILSYFSIKILLDLMHYNYRSLILVKPKYYYLSKLRFYAIKFRKLGLNN